MSVTILVNALRRHREALASRWIRQLEANRALVSESRVAIGPDLVQALLEEVVAMLACDNRPDIPRRHRGRAFAELAAFPENVAICIDTFQAGAQVLGAFVVENAGPFAAWSLADRNRFLGELDAVFHILVHREIETLCEDRLATSAPVSAAMHSVAAGSGLAAPAREVICRN